MRQGLIRGEVDRHETWGLLPKASLVVIMINLCHQLQHFVFFFVIQSHCVALTCLEFINIDQIDFELKVILLTKCWDQCEPPHLATHLSF